MLKCFLNPFENHLWGWCILNETLHVGLFSFISSHFVTLISIGIGKPSAEFVLSSGVLDISCSCSWSLWWCRCLWWNAWRENRLCVCFLPPRLLEMWGLSFLILRVLYTCNCVYSRFNSAWKRENQMSVASVSKWAINLMSMSCRSNEWWKFTSAFLF